MPIWPFRRRKEQPIRLDPERERLCMENAERIRLMSEEKIQELIAADQCPYEPEHLVGVPIGMFHCPLCLEMVLAGQPHPRRGLEHPPVLFGPRSKGPNTSEPDPNKEI